MIHMSEKLRNGRKMNLIDKEKAIDAIESTDWYHITDRGKLSEGAEGEESALYKAEDVYKAIDGAPVVDAIPTEWLYDLADKKEEEKDIKLSAMIKGVVALWHMEKQNDSLD